MMKYFFLDKYHCYDPSLESNWAKFVAIAKDYFSKGFAYSSEPAVEREWEDCVFVYSLPLLGSFCTDCSFKNELKVLKFYLNCDVPSFFFDWREHAELCFRIFLNDRLIGEYCPQRNVLFLSDWIYVGRFIDKACELLRVVCNALNVKKRIVKPNSNGLKVRIKIGADVEFEELRNWSDYSPIRTNIERSLYSEIGVDGSGDQIELRPKPTLSAIGLVRNLRKLIARLNCPISVLGDRFPLGAHIHFELPKELKKELMVRKICRILDEFLGKQLIELSGDARGNYKQLTAYELKDWGFEYRTLPSAILLNPKIARIVFKIAKNVVEYFIAHKEIEVNDELTYRDYRKFARLTKSEYQAFIDFVRSYWETYKGLAINENWVKKKCKKIEMRLLFQDDWDLDIVEYVKSKFENPYWRKLLKGKTIVFYGLRKDRGTVVAGFDCLGYIRIDHVISRDCDFLFGLPRIVRVKERDWDKKELDKMIEAIKNELKKHLKGGV
ncbi:MAG: hypothetical protein QXW71_02110 [Thermoplasmata archaeon]